MIRQLKCTKTTLMKTIEDFKNEIAVSLGHKDYQDYLDNPNETHYGWDSHRDWTISYATQNFEQYLVLRKQFKEMLDDVNGNS